MRQTANVRALTVCQACVLSRQWLLQICRKYKEMREMILKSLKIAQPGQAKKKWKGAMSKIKVGRRVRVRK